MSLRARLAGAGEVQPWSQAEKMSRRVQERGWKLHQSSRCKNYPSSLISIFQIMHNTALQPALAWNHAVKGVLGNTVPA